MYYQNENIINLVRVFDQNDRRGYLRLDLNENPGGLPQTIIAKALSDITPEFISQYPETRHFSEVLSNYLGTTSDHICLVNGSAEGIRYIIQAFTSVHGRIVGVVPSYFMFQVYSKMYDRNFVSIPYSTDLKMDVNEIINALTKETELLILLNPNNPMGNVYSDDEIEKILTICGQKEITVLIDEAYFYFWPKTFIKYALTERHILITRTFSKLFSMAACRLGYVVGATEEIALVQKLCTPHNVNAFAMKIAETIIDTPGTIEKLVADFQDGRQYFIYKLDELGYRHFGEAGNFIFIKPHVDAVTIVQRMKEEKHILIKNYQNVGELGDCLRVSIGERKYMERFINALVELDQ